MLMPIPHHLTVEMDNGLLQTLHHLLILTQWVKIGQWRMQSNQTPRYRVIITFLLSTCHWFFCFAHRNTHCSQSIPSSSNRCLHTDTCIPRAVCTQISVCLYAFSAHIDDFSSNTFPATHTDTNNTGYHTFDVLPYKMVAISIRPLNVAGIISRIETTAIRKVRIPAFQRWSNHPNPSIRRAAVNQSNTR